MIKTTPEIERIFQKPGPEWSPEDIVIVNIWAETLQGFFKQVERGEIVDELVTEVQSKINPRPEYDEVKNTLWIYFNRGGLAAVISSYIKGKMKDKSRKPILFIPYLLMCCARYYRSANRKIKTQTDLEKPLYYIDKNGNRIEIEFIDDRPHNDVEGNVDRTEMHSILIECINKLSPKLRDVIVMVLQEMENEEIADELGISEGTVRKRRYEAIKKLRQCMNSKLNPLSNAEKSKEDTNNEK